MTDLAGERESERYRWEIFYFSRASDKGGDLGPKDGLCVWWLCVSA